MQPINEAVTGVQEVRQCPKTVPSGYEIAVLFVIQPSDDCAAVLAAALGR